MEVRFLPLELIALKAQKDEHLSRKQGDPVRFRMGAPLNKSANWVVCRSGDCGGLKIRRTRFDSETAHRDKLAARGQLSQKKSGCSLVERRLIWDEEIRRFDSGRPDRVIAWVLLVW